MNCKKVLIASLIFANILCASNAYAQQELQFTRITEVCIEIIIPAFVSDQVFGIYRSTEPFVRIIVRKWNLNELHFRAATNAAEG